MEYTIKKLGIGEILDQGIKLLKNHFGTLFSIMLVLFIPIILIQTLIVWALFPDLHAIQGQMVAENARVLTENIQVLMIVNVIFALVFLIVIRPLTEASVISAVSSEYLGRTAHVGESIKHAVRRFKALLGTNLLGGLLIMIGFILLIIPGIYLAFRYYFSSYIVLVEGKSGSAALKKSGFLMKKNMGKAFLIGILLGIIGWFLGLISGLIPNMYIQGIVSIGIQAFLFAFGTAVGVVFYFSSRCQHENFDLTILADAMSEGENTETSEKS